MIEISQPLAELDWIPRPRLLALRRLGLETAEDLRRIIHGVTKIDMSFRPFRTKRAMCRFVFAGR